MNVFCLGGAGRIIRESALDLVQFGDVSRITIADYNENAAQEVAAWLDDPRVDWTRVDVHDHEATVAAMQDHDLVLDGTTISLNAKSTACIAAAGCHGLNLNGFGEEYQFDSIFRDKGKTFVPGFGMTPGVTNMLAKHACDQMESVDSVRVSHGAFRPVAFSGAITETTVYEYDPDLPGRVVYENGEFVQVKPFARPRDIALPEPYGTHPQYIIPHSETVTLADYLQDKGVKLIEVRGTWPPKNMLLIRALHEWGFMRNDLIEVNGKQVGIMDMIGSYLQQAPEGQETELYGYALHVEVEGVRDGRKIRHTLTHTHPASDGSVPGWERLRAYTRCVGIPMAVGAHLMAQGKVARTGCIIPEHAFAPLDVFAELEKRDILIHEDIEEI